MLSLPVATTATANNSVDVRVLPRIRPAGLYLHIPFCFHKCHYCDFYSITWQSRRRMERFVELLLAEADIWRDSQLELSPQTVFFGGGTPSLLPHDLMERLLRGLKERFALSGVREWTVEVNPATADLGYLRMLREHGVDRISLGAQSFDDRELAVLERHHAPDDVEQAVDLSRTAGFERISIDLIYAIPGQSRDSWQASLTRALELKTSHLSCYGLTYEPNTPLAVRRRLGRVQPAPEDLELAMFADARQILAAADLPAYEISNYAAAGCESIHNLAYWQGESYVGLGPSAASHIDGRRFRNEPHLGRWERAVTTGELPVIDYEHLAAVQRMGELAWLNLRLTRGIDVADFKRRTGADPLEVFSDLICELCAADLLHVTADHIRLTDKAWPLADAIASQFLQNAKNA